MAVNCVSKFTKVFTGGRGLPQFSQEGGVYHSSHRREGFTTVLTGGRGLPQFSQEGGVYHSSHRREGKVSRLVSKMSHGGFTYQCVCACSV